ncbi:exosortase Y [Mucilaginibacter sp. UR6-11]|uniref:exosortase Y n=1 Tax=Mucilaginibacter sp. UR6-11 TaxID=1435644 RepID=UPI001E3608C9|nr:exosortase/archaeosortase family protein [Mucilaginibacter sp. UR6-11]MCC8425745.1 exosortase/archaeosortase family protein [Mucilaginibacter sp. UR6-11]
MIPDKQNNPLKFAAWFIGLFLLFYYFNIAFFGITSPGKLYSPFLAGHLNYISALRGFLLDSSAFILRRLGYITITNNHQLLVAGHGVIVLVYTCLGLGVLSFFAAFVLAFPKPLKAKIIFLLTGIVAIEFLNVIRFVLLALFWNKNANREIDHHTIFNISIYFIISISLYFWVKNDASVKNQHAKNRS